MEPVSTKVAAIQTETTRSNGQAMRSVVLAGRGVPMAGLLVPLSGVIAMAGGLSVLLGYRARIGAWLLALFLVPVTVMMHPFWAVKEPMMAQIQMVMFMKNLSMLGGALLISY